MPALRSRSKRFAKQTPKEYCILGSHSAVTSPESSSESEGITELVQHDYTKVASSSSSAANTTPAEILLQIYSLLTPRDFDNARRTCSQWMRVSLNKDLLASMLKRAGWWDAWQQDSTTQRIYRNPSSYESEVWRMSKRFATECLLSGQRTIFEKSGFVETGSVDFSQLARSLPRTKSRGATAFQDRNSHSASTFSVSSCGKYLLATIGSVVYVFRLVDKKCRSMSSAELADSNVVPITSISCPFEVLSATIDTTTSPFVIAALLRNRAGMVCDLDVSNTTHGVAATAGSVDEASESLSSKPSKHNLYAMPTTTHSTPHYFYNICTEDHPPRTIALCPGRRCVAFGCAGGIEIHWVDEATHTDQRRHFPMSQPSEILHFLPNSPKPPTEMRLISSLAGPGVHECACRQSPLPDHPKKCQFNFLSDSRSRNPPNNSSLSLVRVTHCHHYRAMPINDGYHIIFIEPRTGLLCIGSDAPIGGPTSVTRAFVCVPPNQKVMTTRQPETRVPTAFAVVSDLRWGLRVIAAYQDRIILYSIPLDVLNIVRKERERQSDGVMGDNPARDWSTDSEEIRHRRENLIQNANGDWEFLLSARSKPAPMIWPFKVYGKEIGHMDNIVELALQSSNGGARIWAFGSSGSARIFDIDTSTSQYQTTPTTTPTMKLVTLGSDGSIVSATISERGLLGAVPVSMTGREPESGSRKRKASALRDDFVGRYGTSRYVPCRTLDGLRPVNALQIQEEDSSVRRPSFAACIVDFKIPELGMRGGGWKSGSTLGRS
ncbi:hypothetical protein N7486_008636 [Penicillium sp. IBT 16267x]|nr:hypothetical protein N7486_008636 [Penicillium sp. IBT 16267x]